MSNPYPWFPFYASDWLLSPDVMGMSLEAQGLYVKLLAIQWSSGTVPAKLSDISGVTNVQLRRLRRLWTELTSHFEPHPSIPGRLANPRLLAIFEEKMELSRKLSEAGQRGGRAKARPKPYPSESESESESDTTLPHTPTTGASLPPALSLTPEQPKSKRPPRPPWVALLTEHIRGTIGHVAPETVYKNARAAAQQVEDWPPLANGDALSTAEVLCGAVDRYRGDTPARYCSVKAMWGRYAAFVDYWRPGGGLEGLAQ